MLKIKINKESIGNAAKIGGTVLLYGIAMMVSNVSANDIIDKVRYCGNVKYSDVIGVIMDSNMFSSDKNRIINVLKKDGNADYYRAVIQVVNSDMYSSDKFKAITNLCKEEA